MINYYGETLYLTKIYRTDSKKTSFLKRGKYIAFVYGCGERSSFYPVNSPEAMREMRRTFKVERELVLKKETVLEGILK